ncbi:MAG: hypothetical protein J0I45_19940 [Bosea sp.]|nr:hypothetical protein [Bosea sp. (in: a-proteobacteria)]
MMNENATKGGQAIMPPYDDSPEAKRERAEKRRKALGSLKGKISLSMEEALAPLDPEELARWYGD